MNFYVLIISCTGRPLDGFEFEGTRAEAEIEASKICKLDTVYKPTWEITEIV